MSKKIYNADKLLKILVKLLQEKFIELNIKHIGYPFIKYAWSAVVISLNNDEWELLLGFDRGGFFMEWPHNGCDWSKKSGHNIELDDILWNSIEKLLDQAELEYDKER